MSPRDEKRTEDEPRGPQPPTEDEKKAQKPEPKPSDFVFKILPANPKNSLDFEDVADK